METKGTTFKVKTVEQMLGKLSDGLNRNKKVCVTSDDNGFTVVWK